MPPVLLQRQLCFDRPGMKPSVRFECIGEEGGVDAMAGQIEEALARTGFEDLRRDPLMGCGAGGADQIADIDQRNVRTRSHWRCP